MNEEIIYGINPVKEALRGSRQLFELFVADGSDGPAGGETPQNRR